MPRIWSGVHRWRLAPHPGSVRVTADLVFISSYGACIRGLIMGAFSDDISGLPQKRRKLANAAGWSGNSIM